MLLTICLLGLRRAPALGQRTFPRSGSESLCRSLQPQGNNCSDEHDSGAYGEHSVQIGPSGDPAERRAAKAECEIETGGVDTHREAAIFRSDAVHRLNAESGINERVADPGYCSPGRCYECAAC